MTDRRPDSRLRVMPWLTYWLAEEASRLRELTDNGAPSRRSISAA